MAKRVIVLSNGPASVKADIDIDSPYPGQRDDPKLVTFAGTSSACSALNSKAGTSMG